MKTFLYKNGQKVCPSEVVKDSPYVGLSDVDRQVVAVAAAENWDTAETFNGFKTPADGFVGVLVREPGAQPWWMAYHQKYLDRLLDEREQAKNPAPQMTPAEAEAQNAAFVASVERQKVRDAADQYAPHTKYDD